MAAKPVPVPGPLKGMGVRPGGIPGLQHQHQHHAHPPQQSALDTAVDGFATLAFGAASSLCSFYSVVIPATPAAELDDAAEALCLWRLPSGELLIRACGHHFRRTLVWVARAVLSDVVVTGILAAAGDAADPSGALPSVVIVAVGVATTAAFTPLQMALDRYTVTGTAPTWAGGDAKGHSASVVRQAVAVKLVHDAAHGILPLLVQSAVGPGGVGTVCSYAAAAILLKPLEAVSVVMAVRDEGASEALTWLRESKPAEGAEHSWLAGVPAMWRAVPLELVVTGAAGAAHISLLLGTSLIE